MKHFATLIGVFLCSSVSLAITPSGNSFVSSTALGALRNDYSGWVGMVVGVGSNPINVTALGRMVAPGNSQVHALKIVNASTGTGVVSTSVNLQGTTAGSYA